ncbi:hypothetical protein [Halalkalibacter nanhaiisediminis]|uniref:Uncharacterized protein n=1 Tax=Halalkalibacter nanhaiisediminis TaxID=688079 RepID=A0A562QQA3_9BACI|nr:hypothetical protein [Halalkalibacter nanhaiisediminis]TWI58929.1 hypothetical protein IQ10_00637 [Halalkalibacter nanhaiisediminis]
MTKEQLIRELQEKGMTEMLELIEDAETGHLQELELVESIGLVYGRELNEALLNVLKELGVTLIYVTEEDE